MHGSCGMPRVPSSSITRAGRGNSVFTIVSSSTRAAVSCSSAAANSTLIQKARQGGAGGEVAIALAYQTEYTTVLGDLREVELSGAERNCVLKYKTDAPAGKARRAGNCGTNRNRAIMDGGSNDLVPLAMRKDRPLGSLISILITFLVIILVLYLVNMLPIDGRAKQIVRIIVIIIGVLSLLKYLAVF